MTFELGIVRLQPRSQRLGRIGKGVEQAEPRDPRRRERSGDRRADAATADDQRARPLMRRPFRATPRTKPSPSNMSPTSVPSGRRRIALHAPAIRAVVETSSTSPTVVTLCGMVTSAPRILVSFNSRLQNLGVILGLHPHRHDHRVDADLVEIGIVDHRRLERLGGIAEMRDQNGFASDHFAKSFSYSGDAQT